MTSIMGHGFHIIGNNILKETDSGGDSLIKIGPTLQLASSQREERKFWLRSIKIKEPAEVRVGSLLRDF